jgi:4-amino-4-deoxy-L-arabinose transferase-like glycosyltransferase
LPIAFSARSILRLPGLTVNRMSAQEEMSIQAKRLLVLIVLAALIHSIMLSAVIAHPERAIRRDSEDYLQFALNYLSGHGFSRQLEQSYLPSAFRTPVYPLVIAFIYQLFGINNLALVLAQVLMSLLTVVLTYWLGLLLLSEIEAWIGALFIALSSAPAVYSVFILSETLFAMLLILVLLILVLYRQRKKTAWLAAAGIFSGLAILCRPVAAYFPVLVVGLIWLAEPGNWRKLLAGMMAFLIACALVVGPWIWRNMRQIGIPTISTISSYNLLFYNAVSLKADQDGLSQAQARAALQTQANAELAKRGGLENEAIQTQLYDEWGRQIILAHPLRYVVIHLENDLNNFLPDVTDFLELMGVTQGAKGTLSVLNQQGLLAAIEHYFGGRIWLIGLVLPWIALLGFIYLAGMLGVYVLARRKAWFGLALLFFPVLYYTLLPGAPSNPRFRVPVMPYLCLLGGIGCIQLTNWLSKKRFYRKKEVHSADY